LVTLTPNLQLAAAQISALLQRQLAAARPSGQYKKLAYVKAWKLGATSILRTKNPE
jgi:hypothetical protein